MTASHGDTETAVVGRVAKAHGIKGEFAVEVMSDIPGRFDVGAQLQIAGVWHTIRSSRPHQGRMLLTVASITDRTAAELLRGKTVHAAAVDDTPGEYYLVQDLIDCPVVDEHGAALGRVVNIIGMPQAAPYDLLEVRKDDGALWLLPSVDDYVVVEEDGDERIIRIVNPPEGLLDDTKAL